MDRNIEPSKEYMQRAYQVGKLAKKTSKKAQEAYASLTTVQKFLILFGLVAIIVIFYFIFRHYQEMRKERLFASQPIFMTGVSNYQPHDARKVYCYKDNETGEKLPFIPGKLINEKNGAQYTYSFWIYVDAEKWNYRFDEWKHIFHKGTKVEGGVCNQIDTSNKIPNVQFQSPGFWLTPKINQLVCVFNTSKDEERIVLDDIDLNKWINITTVLQGRSVSLYKDGKLERTVSLFYPVERNTHNMYVNYFGGFYGNMAYLQFFNTSLEPYEVYKNYELYKKEIDAYVEHQREKNLKAYGGALNTAIEEGEGE